MSRYIREVFLILRRNAGHSKWQNIRHVKAAKDMERSLLYLKLCQRMKVAIKENGNNSNPTSNLQLAQAIENAKKRNMPIASIQSCIKSCQTDKTEAQPYRFSIKGPRGSILIVTVLTTSYKKTKADICFVLNRVGGIMADQSLEGNFDKTGIVIAVPPQNMENIEETSVDHAIEAGAEEVTLEDNKLIFTCEQRQLHQVRSKLEELNYTVEDSQITYIPKVRVGLEDKELELMSKIITKIEENPEVVEIYDNIE